MVHEHRSDGYKMITPNEGYVEKIFALAEKYFPNNELILNEATSAAFCDFRGPYGGYYLYIKELMKKGVRIDQIGLQCHVADDNVFQNIFDGQRLYSLLDGYAQLERPLVLSEIGLSCDDEELQAQAVEQLYTIWFSHKSTSGIFWWNLDDNGILFNKQRNAMAENLPCAGLCRNGVEKSAYKVLDRLINQEWKTKGKVNLTNGKVDFRGFFGQYEIEICTADKKVTKMIDFSSNSDNNINVEI
jgi:GH35 family endo-1,4-beta-xylanase